MFLGIEIGGTKLQLGVGSGETTRLVALERFDVERAAGAGAIRDQMLRAARPLMTRHGVTRVGIGFGGPVDVEGGRTICSHHVAGWDDFPLEAWCRQELQTSLALGNDADTAALAEARLGAGRGHNPVLYVTVGTGIGGGLVIDGRVYRGAGNGATEIGHLRPGLSAATPDQTLEALAAGPGIARAAQARIEALLESDAPEQGAHDVDDLLARAAGRLDPLTARHVAEAADAGNALAAGVFADAVHALGWGIAQVVTIAAPAVVVVGGGVSLAGDRQFFGPLRSAVDRFVFPPFRGRFELAPAALGEEVVVHGAIALAADSLGQG